MTLRVFPVLGNASYRAEFYPQAILGPDGKVLQRQHLGIDLFAPGGTPLLAADDGVVSLGTDGFGGNVAVLRAADGSLYYYAHLSEYPRGAGPGSQLSVRAGDVVGYVGNTGNARGGPAHSHFEVRVGPTGAVPGGAFGGMQAVDPYAMLRAAEVRYPTAPSGSAIATLGRYVAPAALALALGAGAWWLVSGARLPRAARVPAG